VGNGDGRVGAGAVGRTGVGSACTGALALNIANAITHAIKRRIIAPKSARLDDATGAISAS
jgi:hypothetical protein